MRFYNVFTLALASTLASATRPATLTQSAGVNATSVAPSTVTSASLATVTKIINLTSTVTVSGTPSESLTNVQATEVVTNATFSVIPTGGVLTSAPASTSVCDTAAPSIITSVVTQVSTKTVDHFITVTVGESSPAPNSSAGNSGSKGQAEEPTPVVTTMTTVKPVTTVVVEQATTVFVTSFFTTTVQVQAGETRTRTAMVTSTVTSTGMATHTRTKTSTILVTLTTTNTPEATGVATNNSTTKDTKTRTTSASLSTSEALSSTPCPTDPITLTVTRSANEATATTSKFGIKDDTTTPRSSRSRFTTRTRGTTSLPVTRSAVRSASTARSTSRSVESQAASTTRFSRTTSARASRSTSVIQSTTDADISTLVISTRSVSSDATSSTGRGGRTRTRSSVVMPPLQPVEATETATASGTSAQVTTTSVRTTRSASSTVSRFSTFVISTSTGGRANTRTKTSSAPAASATSSTDPQTSPELDPRAVMSALTNNGQNTPSPGQVASLTSRNNFINFCLTQNVPLTNGQQIKAGSCNSVPMGRILAVNKMPSSKFVFPKNGQTIKANTAFTVRMAIKNLSTGNFVNPATNYYGAPAQTTADGTLIGHSHVVIEKLTSKTQTKPTDPQKFAFFKGLNQAAVGGILTADVTAGLPAGEYRIASINSAANHQPALSAVAQRGSNDDISYFTVE
ncbi:unnamed protein product [Rhizoctonia solani]|uniref:Uncharacterized protein n=1 Tax=Rhizoctonia solani TaxID=456999 RepID=A0A8H3HNV7_9AGAM|nr:unnamed protein product [Rhizoctonia solani]